MATTYRSLKATRYTSLASEQSHTMAATTYIVRMHALTQAVRLRLASADATHFYTIDSGDELELQSPELAGATVYFIEAAASAALEILEQTQTA